MFYKRRRKPVWVMGRKKMGDMQDYGLINVGEVSSIIFNYVLVLKHISIAFVTYFHW